MKLNPTCDLIKIKKVSRERESEKERVGAATEKQKPHLRYEKQIMVDVNLNQTFISNGLRSNPKRSRVRQNQKSMNLLSLLIYLIPVLN